MKKICSVAALVAMAFAGAGSCVAAEQVKESIHPSVNGSPVTLIKDNLITQKLGGRMLNLDVWAGEFIRYDDNIFGQSGNKEEEVVYTTAAGVLLQAGEKGAWNGNVQAQIMHNRYENFSEYNGNEGFIRANGSLIISPALTARGGLSYSRTNDEVRGEEKLFGIDQTNVSAGVTVAPSPFTAVDIDYAHFIQQREQTGMAYTEYDQDSINIRPSYRLTNNTTLYAQGGMSFIKPKQDVYNETTVATMKFGATWAYRDSAKLYAEVGVNSFDFDDNGEVANEQGERVNRPLARIGGELAIGESTKAGFTVAYGSNVGATTTSSKNSAYLDTVSVSGNVEYSPGAGRMTVKATPFWSVNKPSNDTEFREIGLTLGATYCITDWANASLGYRVINTKYDNAASYNRQAVMAGMVATF